MPDAPLTELLTRAGSGDPRAAEEIVPVVYEELRSLARRWLARERAGQTLEPTALVHEAFLRLVGEADPGWNGRRHFFGAAALAMRRILVERARRRARRRHGGGRERIPLDEAEIGAPPAAELDLLDLDEALEELRAEHPRAAEIVMLRYFAGLDGERTASALGISERTLRREWTFARLWLRDRLAPRRDRDDR